MFEGFPLIIGWELTLACNLQCKHCGSSAGSQRINELSTEEILGICDQLPDLLVQEVDFTGGEPLLHKEWQLIARTLIDKGIRVNILTNGLILDDRMIGMIRETGITGIGISLDGLEETHEYIRGAKGGYQAVLDSFGRMQRADIPFNVITTVNRKNIGELPRLYQVLKSHDVQAWRVQGLIPFGRVAEYPDLHLDDDAMFELGDFIERTSRAFPDENPRIICSDGLQYVDVAGQEQKPWRGCPGGIISLGITSDGKVKGCLSMPDGLIEGDLRKNTLWDIWFNPDAFVYSRKYDRSRLGQNCQGCDREEDCQGGCSSNSFSGTGVFHNDPYCFYKIKKEKVSV